MLVSVLCGLSAANIVYSGDFGKYGDCVVWWLRIGLYRDIPWCVVLVCCRVVIL